MEEQEKVETAENILDEQLKPSEEVEIKKESKKEKKKIDKEKLGC